MYLDYEFCKFVTLEEDLVPSRSALEELGVPEIEPGPTEMEIPRKTPKRRFKKDVKRPFVKHSHRNFS